MKGELRVVSLKNTDRKTGSTVPRANERAFYLPKTIEPVPKKFNQLEEYLRPSSPVSAYFILDFFSFSFFFCWRWARAFPFTRASKWWAGEYLLPFVLLLNITFLFWHYPLTVDQSEAVVSRWWIFLILYSFHFVFPKNTPSLPFYSLTTLPASVFKDVALQSKVSVESKRVEKTFPRSQKVNSSLPSFVGWLIQTQKSSLSILRTQQFDFFWTYLFKLLTFCSDAKTNQNIETLCN